MINSDELLILNPGTPDDDQDEIGYLQGPTYHYTVTCAQRHAYDLATPPLEEAEVPKPGYTDPGFKRNRRLPLYPVRSCEHRHDQRINRIPTEVPCRPRCRYQGAIIDPGQKDQHTSGIPTEALVTEVPLPPEDY